MINLTDYSLEHSILEGRHILGDVGFGTLLGAFISALIACLNSCLQYRRDRREWQREKLYELYSQAQESLNELVRLVVMNDSSLKAVGAFHSALGALNRLKFASPPEHQRLIGETVEDLKVMRSTGGAIIPSSCSDDVEAIRDLIFRLAQEDKRLGGLFQSP